jgi:23S rRNA pseudouridine2605 synthase
MRALDADGDHEISADEIAKAADALKKLDTNSDGKLTPEELRPQFAGRGPGDDDRGPPRDGERRPPRADGERRGDGPPPEGRDGRGFGRRSDGPPPEGRDGERHFRPRPEGRDEARRHGPPHGDREHARPRPPEGERERGANREPPCDEEKQPEAKPADGDTKA